MWRPAHGATTRPGPRRPASGYGRPLGRPGPLDDDLADPAAPLGVLDAATDLALAEVSERWEPEGEVPAPVTP